MKANLNYEASVTQNCFGNSKTGKKVFCRNIIDEAYKMTLYLQELLYTVKEDVIKRASSPP